MEKKQKDLIEAYRQGRKDMLVEVLDELDFTPRGQLISWIERKRKHIN